MKKVLAVVLAMIIALSCAVMAFAEDDYKCVYCDKAFSSQSAKETHEAGCKDNPANWICGFCKKKCKSYDECCDHEDICALNPSSPNYKEEVVPVWGTCPFCGQDFDSSAAYTDHLQHCKSNDDAHIDFTDGEEVVSGKFSFAKIIDEIQEFFNISVDNHNTSLITSIESVILGFFEFILGLGDLGLGYIDAGVLPVA